LAGHEPAPPFSWEHLRVQELEERVRATRQATIYALNQMLDLKDLNTGVHSTRLAEWAVRIGQELGIDEGGLEDIEVGALLHDAGKVGVPDAILRKAGPLNPDEWRVMRMHPEFSWAVLRLVPGLERASLFALHHHEKFDGSGYPSGLRGEEIPIGARIVSVIDAFDAMVAVRPYKDGLPCEEALRRLILDSGSHFDPIVVHHFLGIARAEMPSVFAATGLQLPRASGQPSGWAVGSSTAGSGSGPKQLVRVPEDVVVKDGGPEVPETLSRPHQHVRADEGDQG
jgi:HD-GYP domain-containing protein (c-di-GMP phosphodiesterase class II)